MTDKKIVWKLKTVMQDKGLAACQLAFQLNAHGYKISSSHLTRLINKTPKKVNIDFISHVCGILGCKTEDILSVES